MSGDQNNRRASWLWGRRVNPVLLLALLAADPGFAAHTRTTTAAAIAPVEQYTRRIWRVQDGLPEDTVQAIQQSPDGYLWIGTTGGLVRFDGSHFLLYDHATTPVLADNSVFCVLSARDGSLWIGTDGGGLVHFKDGVFHPYTQTNGLAPTTASSR
jgi:ligand-binding sensor domain-containing protein